MSKIKRKPRGEGHERRAEILDVARRIFAEQGLEAATMRRVAQAAGISIAAVYIYFEDKQAILAALRDATFLELERRLAEASGAAADPAERIRRQFGAYLAFAVEHPDMYRVTFRSHLIRAPRAGRPTSAAAAAGRAAFTILSDELGALMRAAGTVSEERVHTAAEAAWAAAHGLASLAIDVPDFPRSGLDGVLDEVVAMVLSRLRDASAEMRLAAGAARRD